MAVVYRAHQAVIDRVVAIKVLLGEFTRQPDFLERFKREARVTGSLRHAHVLPIYDYGEFEGTPYLVAPFIETGTLADWLRQIDDHRLPLHEALRLGAQVAGALDHAHSRGVIHRDVKPSNVLIDHDSNALLGDFGLAKLTEGDSTNLTGAGAMVGTPYYMSPEQCSGLPVDARADVYALAVMLFEMIAGHVPFKGKTSIATVLLHIDGPIPEVPGFPALNPVLTKGLAKNPDDRFKSAGEMMAALFEAAGTHPTTAYTPLPANADRVTHHTSPLTTLEPGASPPTNADVPRYLGHYFAPAVAEADRLNHGFLGVEHVFITLARNPASLVAGVLKRYRLSADELIDFITAYVGHGDGALFQGGLRPTPRLTRIVCAAVDDARQHGRDLPTERELLAAMLREGQSVPVRALARNGVPIDEALALVESQAAFLTSTSAELPKAVSTTVDPKTGA